MVDCLEMMLADSLADKLVETLDELEAGPLAGESVVMLAAHMVETMVAWKEMMSAGKLAD